MANAINLQFADWRNGAAYHELAEVPSGTESVWAGYESMNYVTLFVFTTTAPTTGISLAYVGGANGGTNDSSGSVLLKYRLLDAADSSYQNANASSTADGSFTWGQGSQTVSITKTLAAGTHYLYIWSGRADNYLNYGSFSVSTTNLSVTYTGAASYKFTASVSTGITGTFTIFSSPFGRSGSISSGATIYNGEVLRIAYSVNSAYVLGTHTINGTTFTTPTNHTVTGAVSVVLSATPGLSTIAISGDGYFGNQQTITVTRKSSSYSHRIYLIYNGAQRTIAAKTTNTTINWTPATGSNSMMHGITNAMQQEFEIFCETFSGSQSLGTTSISFTLKIPTSLVTPTPSIALSDAMGYYDTFGGYVKGKSKLSVAVTDGLKYSASIASRRTTANGATYTQASFTTNELTGAGSVSTTVRDSRGQSGTASAAYTVLDYAKPAISAFSVHRCTATGIHNDEGAYFVAEFSWTISPLNNNNTKVGNIYYKKTTASSWTAQPLVFSDYSGSGRSSIYPADVGSSYDVRIQIRDAFSTVTKTTTLSTTPVTIDVLNGGYGVAIGKQAESANLFDVQWPSRFRGAVAFDAPEGTKESLGIGENLEMVTGSASNNMGFLRWVVGNTANARSGHAISLNFLDEGLSLYDGTAGEQILGIALPLSIARGGTGQTSLAGVQSAFGIAYASGDTETINNVAPLSGYGYSTTVAVFTVPVSKSMVNVSSVSVTAMQGLLMGVTGLLEGSSNNYNWLTNSAYTVTAQIASPGIVRLRLQKSSAFSYTVDTPLIFAPSTLTLSFS